MNYIVFDLEWNQPYTIDAALIRKVKFPIIGEIFQIGAVKLNEQLEEVDQFNVFIKPKYLPYLHHHVEKLTGMSYETLEQTGVSFEEGYRAFQAWCGPDSALVTWGPDDVDILRDNILYSSIYDLESKPWYDLQYIYSREVLKEPNRQRSLQNAMAEVGLKHGDLRAHDGLNDAIFTSHICRAIPFLEGVKNYPTYGKKSEFYCYPLDIVGFQLYEGFQAPPQEAALKKRSFMPCPHCHKAMILGSIEQVGKLRYMSPLSCGNHEEYMIHWMVGRQRGRNRETFFLAKTITTAPDTVIQQYEKAKEKNRIKREKYLAKLAELGRI